MCNNPCSGSTSGVVRTLDTGKSRGTLQKPQRGMANLPDTFICVKERNSQKTDCIKEGAEHWNSRVTSSGHNCSWMRIIIGVQEALTVCLTLS